MSSDFEENDLPRPSKLPPSPPPIPPINKKEDDYPDDFTTSSGQNTPNSNKILLIIVAILLGVLFVCGGGIATVIYFFYSGDKTVVKETQKNPDLAKNRIDNAEQERKTNGLKSEQNLKQIAIAFKEYESAKGDFPTNSLDSSGKPLLSWRVHLLPYLGHEELYRKFKLNEPWDSPSNQQLIPQMPEVYAFDNDVSKAQGKTYYRGFMGPNALFEKRYSTLLLPKNSTKPTSKIPIRKLATLNVSDGLSKTILCVEGREPSEWTKPDDIPFQKDTPIPRLGVKGEPDYRILMMDGTIKKFSQSQPIPSALRDAITISGGEINTLP